MNQDEGSYTLSHSYDRFLATSHHEHLMKASDRDQNVKVNLCWLCLI